MIDEVRAKKYCKEDISKIENYDKAIADTTQTWICHHRTAIWWNCTTKDLIENKCYYHRKACELIFVTESEHKSLHHTGKTLSDETKKKISEARKGKPRSDETKMKISASNKGRPGTMKGRTHSEKTKLKMSETKKGNNNSFYGHAHSEETKRKMSEACKAAWAKRKEGGK